MNLDFLEIGTSDFNTEIQRANESTIGMCIEPVKYYLDRLPNKKNIIKVHGAMSNADGKINIHYIPVDDIKNIKFPEWFRGCNSINKPHPTVKNWFIDNNLDYEEYENIDVVNVYSFETLVNKYNINSIEFLKIDTEGHDCVILNNYIDYCEHNNKLFANKIMFESNSLSNKNDVQVIIERLKKFGYKIKNQGYDTILIKI